MDTRSHIVSSAERVFDRYGFAATGMDQLTRAADVSSRTLYKHVGSKADLITAVLEERCRRFFSRFDVHSVDALFNALEKWTRAEGARGCLFLRALGETGGETPVISNAVAAYRANLRQLVRRAVDNDVGSKGNDLLVQQILVLLEGATSVASYHGIGAISAARAAAAVLLKQAR